MLKNKRQTSQIGISCYFKAQVIRKDGAIKYEGPWFSNTLLNEALNRIGTSIFSTSFFSTCNVGEGSEPPQASDTGLGDYVGSTHSRHESEVSYETSDSTIPKREHYQVFEFTVGTFDTNVNLNELGLSQSSNSDYFNRQLFRDDNGDPVTVTVRSDEGLRVTTKVIIYGFSSPDSPKSVSFDFNGETVNAKTYQVNSLLSLNTDNYYLSQFGTNSINLETSNGNTIHPSSSSSPDYIQGSFNREATFTWDPGKFDGDEIVAINFFVQTSNMGRTAQFSRMEIDSPIGPFDSQQEVVLTARRSWAPYST